MNKPRTELSRRSQGIALSPWDGSGDPPLEHVLTGEACDAAWRVVELVSLSDFPFDVKLTWAAGAGGGQLAWVTVSRATRIGIYARSIQVQAANHVNGPNAVNCTIADSLSFVQTHNQYEERGGLSTAGHGLTQEIWIPPFARFFRVLLSDDSLLSTVYIQTYDGQQIRRESTLADAQPETGVPLGGIRTLELVAPADVDYRVVFDLSI